MANTDSYTIVQQVAALQASYEKVRCDLAAAQARIDTLTEDNRRLQKIVKDGQR
jgi:hypothetical protein